MAYAKTEMTFTLGELKSIGDKSEATAATINALNTRVSSLLSKGEESEKSTLALIGKLFLIAMETGPKIGDFAEKNRFAIIRDGKCIGKRGEIIKMLNENFDKASDINLDELQITGNTSLAAAKALLELCQTLQNMLPTPHLGLAEKQTALAEKVNTYEAAHANQEIDSIKTLPDLNQYIKKSVQTIGAEATAYKRLERYQTLKSTVEALQVKLCDELSTPPETTGPAEKTKFIDRLRGRSKTPPPQEASSTAIPQNELTETVELTRDITKNIKTEAKAVSDEIAKLIEPFKQKIETLGKISERINPDRVKNSFDDAILYGRQVIKQLDAARENLEQTGDIQAFKTDVKATFDAFSSDLAKTAFATNRSHPLFIKFISGPFEALKAGINWVIQKGPESVRSISMFKPAETGTTKAFEALKKGTENIDNDEENTPPNAGGNLAQ
ncbi:MAG: hypothetical protein P1U32_06860 [Legionellaceae bacterium]|nr:hypothetical protein [Legionellaceae bacterium]